MMERLKKGSDDIHPFWVCGAKICNARSVRNTKYKNHNHSPCAGGFLRDLQHVPEWLLDMQMIKGVSSLKISY